MNVRRDHAKKALIQQGRFIRKSRRANGLSQADLAKALKISQSKISKIEAGRVPINIQEWFYFCRKLKLPVNKYQDF
jgi:ribosome-binding protein aMBF1 (putative translation factor)